MSQSKEKILERLVGFVGGYVPLADATMATLGGSGLEARVWQAAKIPERHCYLIERSPQSMERLLRQFHDAEFRFLRGNLTRFPSMIAARVGRDAGLDFFHWDLCGTVEPVITELTGMLPLLARGKGRVLAITLADQRRNLSLEDPQTVQRVCRRIFGSRWNDLWQHLVTVHRAEAEWRPGVSADPENVALREAATLLYTLLALTAVERRGQTLAVRRRGFPLSRFLRFRSGGSEELLHQIEQGTIILAPDRIDRYLYWKDPTGFRMRTYAIHLQTLASPVSIRDVGESYADFIIARSPFRMFTGESFEDLWPPPTIVDTACSQTRTEETTPMAVRTDIDEIRNGLKPVYEIIGPQHRAQIDTLFTLAEAGAKANGTAALLESVVGRLNGIVQEVSPHMNGAAPPAPAPRPARPSAPAARPSDPVPPIPARVSFDTLTDAQKDDVRLELVLAAIAGPEKLEKKIDEYSRRFGMMRKANRRNILGGLRARGCGKFRADFVARLALRETTDAARDRRIVELASQLGEDAKDLRSQVTASKAWTNHASN